MTPEAQMIVCVLSFFKAVFKVDSKFCQSLIQTWTPHSKFHQNLDQSLIQTWSNQSKFGSKLGLINQSLDPNFDSGVKVS